ncbi:DoxX family membrane protein [Streptomyces sp. B-S-A8]|uniref:DoxX family membrane protein n=1 Tax=Streptomyces solicavernae TaxID=3043614 RepID=A0ABT6RUY6_9ACTN|nr:DoxX family membrane protein [Streptomyces sp. B-S-A8]MDI3388257.1 DoxX family membrane protein [Streptomyces sp. B-S-A8]
MSVDTRTPRTPAGGGPSGFDDGPALSMVKVPCDPAQVIVNHASFRVQLPTAQQTQSPRIARQLALAGLATGVPAGAGAAAARRRAPVVWSGKSVPGDPGAGGLLQAVRTTGVQHDASLVGTDGTAGTAGAADPAGAATQVIPRVTEAAPPPHVIGPREPDDSDTRILPRVQSSGSVYDEEAEAAYAYEELARKESAYEEAGERSPRRHGNDSVRHAYYPGRRLNLGVVLLPLRIFLGFISIYAGMGKLCDPVYFDGGERGSMVKWLNSLHPWELAEPMRDWALAHPVGAGLVIAFLQVIVGVLTVLGLWQRAAAVVGGLLSAALLVTVSWKSVPVYDAPDIIYLAAWSPLIIAGAPVYSVDGWLAGEAWRRLGPRAELWELRRRVLRRGFLVGTVIVGLTLLVGSLLGGAVRDADRVTAPGPGEAPRNEQPGSPLPTEPKERRTERQTPSASTGAPTQGNTSTPPSAPASTPGTAGESGSADSRPSETAGTGQQPPPQESAPPSTSSGPTSSGGTGSGGSGSEEPGLVGGLLG